MKLSLQKKLLSYSTLATALLAIDHTADAQVIYTAVNPPDTVIIDNYHSGSNQFGNNFYDTIYYLDLNNDGIKDFQFNLMYNSSYSSYESDGHDGERAAISVTAIGKNKVDADTALKFGNSVCSNKNWKSNQPLAMYSHSRGNTGTVEKSHFFKDGPFINDTDKYLPLQLNVNGNTYYGWVRITIEADARELIVSSYAYNATPNACITAGDTIYTTTSVATTEAENNNVSLWSFNNKVYVKLSNTDLLSSTLDIYNTVGQKVFSSSLTASQTDIDLADFAAGVYIAKVTGKQSSFVKKIVIN